MDRKKPVGRMSSSSSSGSAAARSAAVGYRAKSAGVTMLTRSSVVWADSTVATRSWKRVGEIEFAQVGRVPGVLAGKRVTVVLRPGLSASSGPASRVGRLTHG